MKTKLAICLSLLLTGCMEGLPDKPAGWACTYFYDESGKDTGFYCNGLKYPESRQFYAVDDPEIQKAHVMPLKTFEKYQAYVQTLKEMAEKRCR